MARSRYQVLVIPYFLNHGEPVYGVFRRRDMGLWQFISGVLSESPSLFVRQALLIRNLNLPLAI